MYSFTEEDIKIRENLIFKSLCFEIYISLDEITCTDSFR